MVIKDGNNVPPHTGDVWGTLGRTLCILEFLRSLSYFGVMAIIAVFMFRRLNVSGSEFATYHALYGAVTYATPILWGYLADAKCGRVRIIQIGLFIYACAYPCYLIADRTGSASIGIAAYCFCFGVGVAMSCANLMVFSADQFNPTDPEQVKGRSKYFGYRYWATNSGAFIAYMTVGVFSEGLPELGFTTDISYTAAFAIYGTFGFIMIIGFHLVSRKCWEQPPGASALQDCFTVTKIALKKSKGKTGHFIALGVICMFTAVGAAIPAMLYKPLANFAILGVSYTNACFGLIAIGSFLVTVFSIKAGKQKENWVMSAVGNCDFKEKEIRAVSQAWKMMIFVPLEITMWFSYNQLVTTFIAVGCQYRNASLAGIPINSAALPLFNCAFIITIIPILNKFVYPTLWKMGGIWSPTPLKRITFGFIFCSCSMFSAAVFEIRRKTIPILLAECTEENIALGWCTIEELGQQVHELSSCYSYVGEGASEPVPVHDVNVIWMAIPFIIFALSEVFANVTFYELFYSQVPETLKSVMQSVNFFSNSLGCTVAGVFASMFAAWLPNNFNHGRVEYYFGMVGSMEVFNLFIFFIVAQNFDYLPGSSGLADDVVPVSDEDDEVHLPANEEPTEGSQEA